MGTRVLLADDSITIQKLVEMAFADTDFELLCVSDGKQAVDKLAAFQPQIILADAIMPIMDGYQVCEAVKANPITKDTPVILLTGRFQPYDEARAASVGIDERIVKPFVQDQLVELVQSFAPQDVDNTLDIEEPEDPITAPVEPVLEPVAEDEGEPVEAVQTEVGPTLDLDSHSTIRVKPGDIKQFLQEPEEDEVLELDEPSESLDEMVLDEDDLEPIEDDDLEPLEADAPAESLDDSFAASIDSINLDSGEEEQLDETLSLGSENLDLPSFEAGTGEEAQEANVDDHVLDLEPERDLADQSAMVDEIEEVNFEVQEEELEKTVKLSPEEMLDSIEQEALESSVEPEAETDPLAEEVFELDPEIVPTASLSDEPDELDLPSPEDFSSDSFEMESPSPVNIEPPEMVEEPEDLLDLDESQGAIEPLEVAAEEEVDEIAEIEDVSAPQDIISFDQPDPDSIPTQSLDDLEDEPMEDHPEVDTGPIDDALNQTDETDLDEDGFPDLEPLEEFDSLPDPEPEDDPVMDLDEGDEEEPGFAEIEEPLLGDLSEESMTTLDEHELSAEPEFEELEDFSTEEPVESLSAASTESVEDTASGMSFNPEQSLDLDEDAGTAKVSLDSNQMDYIVEAVAKRVVALLGEQTVREIAWEVIPELSEAMIKKRIYELEKTVDDE